MNPNFACVGARLLRDPRHPPGGGCVITETDGPQAPKVAVVNESFARHDSAAWAIGRRFGYTRKPEYSDVEIVGIVRDGKAASLREEQRRFVYLSHAQRDVLGAMHLLRRHRPVVRRAASCVNAIVRARGPDLPVSQSKTMRAQVRESLFVSGMVAALSAAFGVLAMPLAALGLDGVMAFAVSLRAREIGIRMALGAQRRDVLRMVLRRGRAGGRGRGPRASRRLRRWPRHRDPALRLERARPPHLRRGHRRPAPGRAARGLHPARRAALVDPMVALPPRSPAATMPTPMPRPARDDRAGRVLVADDQRDVREAVRLLLKLNGFSVEKACLLLRAGGARGRGRRALLPPGDGPQLRARHHLGARRHGAVDRARALAPALPIVVMTAWSTKVCCDPSCATAWPISWRSPSTTPACWPRFGAGDGGDASGGATLAWRRTPARSSAACSPGRCPRRPATRARPGVSPSASGAMPTKWPSCPRAAWPWPSPTSAARARPRRRRRPARTPRCATSWPRLWPRARSAARPDRALSPRLAPDRFVSLAHAVLDRYGGTMTYGERGPPAAAADARDATVLRLDQGGPVLGMLEDARYEEAVSRCGPATVCPLHRRRDRSRGKAGRAGRGAAPGPAAGDARPGASEAARAVLDLAVEFADGGPLQDERHGGGRLRSRRGRVDLFQNVRYALRQRCAPPATPRWRC